MAASYDNDVSDVTAPHVYMSDVPRHAV